MPANQLWKQFTDAIAANDAVTAFEHAADLKGRLDAGEPPPSPIRPITLVAWLAGRPEVGTRPGAVIVNSTEPSLYRLSSHLVVSQDLGENTTVLVPR